MRFDKLDPWKVTTALIKRGVDKDIALWYRDYLTDRHAHLHIKGSSTTRRIEIGCPQGGVLSTILWNLAFDDMLNLFKGKGIICVRYADDGCILVTGRHIKSLYRDMNEALERCRNWAEEYGLGLSPSKTNYMLFTKKSRKSYEIPQQGIRIGTTAVDTVQSCKYLGLDYST